MTESRSCLVCGAPTTSKLGICNRTKECSAEYGRRYMTTYNYAGVAPVHCIACGAEVRVTKSGGRTPRCKDPVCVESRRRSAKEAGLLRARLAAARARQANACPTCGRKRTRKTINRSGLCGWCNPRERHALELLSAAKKRARETGLEFGLCLDDLLPLPETCAVFGVPLAWRTSGRRKSKHNSAFCSDRAGFKRDSPSIDRIDSSRGYVKDNVWVISNRANCLKNDATIGELKAIVSALEKVAPPPTSLPSNPPLTARSSPRP